MMLEFLLAYAIVSTIVCLGLLGEHLRSRRHKEELKEAWRNRDYWKEKAEEYSTQAGWRYTRLQRAAQIAAAAHDEIAKLSEGQ